MSQASRPPSRAARSESTSEATSGVRSSSGHVPVFLRQVLDVFSDDRADDRAGARSYFDGTFGRGGHARAVLDRFPGCELWAFDQDEDAIRFGSEAFKAEVEAGHAHLIRANYAEIEDVAKREAGFPAAFDLMLLDLGVSSPQLDEAHRGFSFYHDGPLDMRMNRNLDMTAAEIVNTWEEQELARVFIELGEVQRPFRVVRAIVHDRKQKPFETTRQLASLIERVDGWQKKGMHPATRYFMGLRLAVNDELGVLERALPLLIRRLADGGRLAVITFHSLEDRIVKNIFKAHLDQGHLVSKKVIKPTEDDVRANPRARSAKLRAFVRGVEKEKS
ncbi:MAG: 16S rRNA (cytosine(1402)-N(4))-methyltransferase RsmH [Bdellovibrionaceae bacterium]|nr:16S rRNA (cytosine(1402)-N(4))-methyltransferase RsmH [Pseudobdellovibrionaceae bacterium]